MAKHRRIFSQRKHRWRRLFICFALLVFISLPWLRYWNHKSTISKPVEVTKELVSSAQTDTPASVKPGYLFSVAIDDRHHYLAKKVNQDQYSLEYVSTDAVIGVCQEVYTTGLDHLFEADILVGYIASIDQDQDSIYQHIIINKQHQCP